MPPSPATRSSPRRELKAETHKRARSLESGFLFREIDDDLALFNEVQTKERDNFLLQSNDDFEDVFATRLQYFSDHKVGLSVAARGESANLLNEDGDKNDYDWLITPPDTPLFPSLDDESQPVNLAPRGRPRSQPISISRSSTMEKSYRSSRGSASPNRLSPSPRSSQSTSQSRGRPSSATHSSPPPKLHSSTPSRRPSPPPGKPSTSVPRSSTPTSRRMSTGSSNNVAPPRARGTSPIKTRRGNSASPKIKAWQSNIPGFSLEAPPNLRTSLADRPASYVRGSSPASRNGSRSSRQSMSPTPSRSVSSLQSHERDHFSPHSKGSIASSGDDDVDSLQSVAISTLSASRSMGTFQNSSALGLSKKPNRIVSSSSAPKRSFDSGLRQMDHRKAPQNMFRPLLSSVPTSTFYGGKVATTHRSMVSRNSSVTTSSTASTDLGVSGVHDTEESEQNQEEATGMYILGPISDVQDEVFAYDKDHTLSEDVKNKMRDTSYGSQYNEFHRRLAIGPQSMDSEARSRHDISAACDLVGKDGSVNVHNYDDTVLCPRCGCSFISIALTEGDLTFCPDCKSLEESSARTTPLTTMIVGDNPPEVCSKLLDSEPLDTLQPSVTPIEPLEVSKGETGVDHLEVSSKGQQPSSELNVSVPLEDSLAEPLIKEVRKSLLSDRDICESYINHETSGGEVSLQPISDFTNSTSEAHEDAGIALLLKKSNSGKRHVVQGRNFLSSNTDDLSCIRDSANSLRSSAGYGSLFTSSSTDFSSVRHVENRFQRQPSGKKSDMENYRYDMHSKHQRSLSSFSGASSHAFQTSSLTMSSHEETSEISVVYVEKYVEEAGGEQQEQSSSSESKVGNTTYGAETEGVFRVASEYASNVTSIHLDDGLVAPVPICEESASYEKGDNFPDSSSNAMDIEVSDAHPETCIAKGNPLSDAHADRVGIKVQDGSLLGTMSEEGIENDHLSSPASEDDVSSRTSRNSKDEKQEPSGPLEFSNDIGGSVDDSTTSNHACTLSESHARAILEEATIVLPDEGAMKPRSLTLEEATDTILFCSSIVHNLAYEAANIAIEKEVPSIALETDRPSIAIVGRPNTDRVDPRTRTTSKRTKKSQKVRKQAEKERKAVDSKTDAEDNMKASPPNIIGAPNHTDTLAPPKLESKCNCTIM